MMLMLGQQVKLCFYIRDFIWFSLDLEEQLAASRREIEEARHWEIDLENHHETLQRATLGAVAAVNARVFLLKIACKISQFVPKKWQLMASAMVPVLLLLQRNCVQGTSFVTWNLVFRTLIGWKIKRT
jgi:hypothetical protein